MIILILFAFIGGIVTILSPCILPVLPIVLSGSLTGGKRRPVGIVTGFILSFTFFTLFLSAIVKATGLPSDALRTIAIILIFFFGLSLILPKLQEFVEKLFSRISSKLTPQSKNKTPNDGFLSGIPVGISLGLLWSPCVGPILTAIITLAATSTINGSSILITFAYAIGTAIPLLAITYGGRQLLIKHPILINNTTKIQKGFGVVMIPTAVALFGNFDRSIQTIILTTFPNYGTGLTKIEENPLVANALKQFGQSANTIPKTNLGKPMNDIQVPQVPNSSHLPRLGAAPGFMKKSGEWVNTPPLTMEGLKGNVVLVDFWTYTCINCIRTLPYLKTWNDKYKEKGLVIIGVHTPEFEFEKDTNNVKKAVKDFAITYPVVQDNAYGIWQDYNNQYWPAHYLIDKTGQIRDTHFGEGNYDETEKNIQSLLSEDGPLVEEKINNPTQSIGAQTPETYLGASRMDRFASLETIQPDTKQIFSVPKELPANSFAFSGVWTVGQERAMPAKNALLLFHFNAQNVYLVMRPKDSTKPGKILVHTKENEPDATISVTDDKLYTILSYPTSIDDILTLEFLDDNLELYAFTFG